MWNPMQIKLERDGVMRDKYGREFEHDTKVFKRRRRNSASPAVHAATHVSGVTFEHRSGWYVHSDTAGQQRRMLS